MTQLAIALYPRRKSTKNPFLTNLTRALEDKDVVVHPWLLSSLFRRKLNAVILNWAENLWDESQSNPISVLVKRAKRTLLIHSLDIWRSQGTQVIFVAHNFFPHGSIERYDFWNRSGLELKAMIDGAFHFSFSSINFYQPLLNRAKFHSVVPFPVSTTEEAHFFRDMVTPITRLLVVGANQPRKNLRPLLLADYESLALPIYVSGFKSKSEAARCLKIPTSSLGSHVKLLGHRISNTTLNNLLEPGTALILNQSSQLNSGLLWQAVSRGGTVIAPQSDTNLEIQTQLGSHLIKLFEEPLTPAVLESLLAHRGNVPRVQTRDRTFGKFSVEIVKRLTDPEPQ